MSVELLRNFIAGRRKRAMCEFHLFPEGYDLSWIRGIDPPREMWATFGLPKGVLATGTDLLPWFQTRMGKDYRQIVGSMQCEEAVAIAKLGSSSGSLVFDVKYSIDGTTWLPVITGLTILANAHIGASTTFETAEFLIPNAAFLRLDCTAAGTTTADEQIVVEIRGFMPE